MARILLAEDDDNLRFFLARALRRAGHEVSDYGDGESALYFMNEHAVDLLLADVVMPGLDGIELARRIDTGTSLAEIRWWALEGLNL